MTNIYELPSQEQRHDEASLWIEKLDDGLSTAEQETFQQWMAADPENEALLIKMAGLWDKMDSLGRLSGLFPEPASHQRPLTSPGFVLPIAASVLLAVFVGVWAVLPLNGFDSSSDVPAVGAAADGVYATAVGEHATVTLVDGTEIVLNTNSRIRVKYTPQHRLLILDRGEVHVRVADNKDRPLSVIAGGNIVQAIGTEFNIEITYDQRIELVVLEGKVRVGVHAVVLNDEEPGAPAVMPLTSVTVAAGEELILGLPDEEVTEVSPADIDVKLSWRSGNLIFRGESLEDAMEEVGRYTTVEFVFLDDDLRKVRIAGLFKAGDVDGLLAVLRENFDIAYERVDERRVLLSAQ